MLRLQLKIMNHMMNCSRIQQINLFKFWSRSSKTTANGMPVILLEFLVHGSAEESRGPRDQNPPVGDVYFLLFHVLRHFRHDAEFCGENRSGNLRSQQTTPSGSLFGCRAGEGEKGASRPAGEQATASLPALKN